MNEDNNFEQYTSPVVSQMGIVKNDWQTLRNDVLTLIERMKALPIDEMLSKEAVGYAEAHARHLINFVEQAIGH